MKKAFIRIISFCLIAALTFSALVIPASAFEWSNVSGGNYAYYRDPYGANSSYASSKFYKNLTRVPLTGDGARDTVAVALSQMGYLEGDYEFSGEIGGTGNVTEFGDYMGISGYAWCAAFCSWVYYNAQVTDLYGYSDSCGENYGSWGYIWSDTYVPNWSNQLYDFGYYRFSDYYRSSYSPSQASYKPQPGDLIFFCAGYSPLDEGHIGLVVYSDDSYVYTAEGNTSSQDGVESEGGGAFFKRYALSSSAIAGYGAMPFNKVSGLPPIDYSGQNPTNGLYINVSGPASVFLNRDDSTASWTLPASSIFEVYKIEEDKYGYTMLYSKCEINGETVCGWIPLGDGYNTWSRTVQIYAAYEAAEDVPVDGTPFWVTHYNNTEVEGAGVIMTQSYTGGAWNLHVAFAPVAGTDAYEITAISDGTVAGGATPLSIPSGGFVYMLNRGNDWPSLYASDPVTYSYAATYPDYTSTSCDAMISNAQKWKVGDQLVFTNIDIANKKNPSPTPYVNWYDESYKCVAGFKTYGEGTDVPDVSEPDISDPDISEPDISDPDVSEPDVSEPVFDPDIFNPDIPAPPTTVPKPNKVQEAGIPGSAGNVAWGCDLSFYNVGSSGWSESDADYSLVDFKRMKADGCDFVILRLGSEDSTGRYYDPHFVTYYNMAREAGMDIGLYFYSYALTYAEAQADAEFVMDVIEDYGMYFEYPLYIDIEEQDQLALSTSLLSDVCYGWCETMEENGYFPGIYGNYGLYDGVSSYVKNTYDFWIAWVSSADSISTYTPWAYNLSDECGMWQYSFYGYEYDGIGLDMLDVNVAYKDYPAIMKKYGFNNINGTGNNILSGNYYPDANTRADDYADDQKKLTDGNKGSLFGGEGGRYSGWYTDSLDIIVETEGVYGYNTFNVYAATNSSWGITSAPIALTVSVSDTLDGTYTKIAYSEDVTLTATGTDGWSTYMLTAYISKLTNKCFVKFTLTPAASDEGMNHIWLDEIEVVYTADVNPDDTDDAFGNGGSDDDNNNDNEFEKGDVTGDGKINMFDYIAVKAHYLEKSLLTGETLARADVTGDGKVNMFDYIALKNLVVKG